VIREAVRIEDDEGAKRHEENDDRLWEKILLSPLSDFVSQNQKAEG
jgi:hypothetical protein